MTRDDIADLERMLAAYRAAEAPSTKMRTRKNLTHRDFSMLAGVRYELLYSKPTIINAFDAEMKAGHSKLIIYSHDAKVELTHGIICKSSVVRATGAKVGGYERT